MTMEISVMYGSEKVNSNVAIKFVDEEGKNVILNNDMVKIVIYLYLTCLTKNIVF